MKKKNLKSLNINKKTISNFNTVFGGKAYSNSCALQPCTGGDTAQSFCAGAETCVTDCEAATETEGTVCCN